MRDRIIKAAYGMLASLGGCLAVFCIVVAPFSVLGFVCGMAMVFTGAARGGTDAA